MSRQPFFSVVIPLYNKELYIEATLKSVLNQTFDNFEIIIVNDGSTDNSKDIINDFNDNRIKKFSIENKGVSNARNFGIIKANANLIAFLDADDIWYKNHLETIASLINTFPDAGMYCGRYNIIINEKYLKKTYIKGVADDYKGFIKNYFESNILNPIPHTSSIVIPKSIFYNIGFFHLDMKSGQDTYLWTQIALKYKVVINDKVTSLYKKNDSSLSSSHHVKDRILFLDKFKKDEKKNKALKKYMDINRYAVALDYKLKNKLNISRSIYKKIDKENINLKQKIVFTLPLKMLKWAFYLKRKLDKNGIFISLYK